MAMRMISIISLAALLGGCALLPANWTTTAIPFKPSHGKSRLIEADLRAIISAKRGVKGSDGFPKIGPNGKPVTDLAICAEPSPDALKATAKALGAKLSDKEGLQALFNASTAQSVASIGLRTQTIQLLRDAYYRLCEAYLNDGIDAIAYDVLQRRFQSQIIAFLAVEQLTGAVKADQVALTTAAAGQASTQAELIAEALKGAEKELPQLQEEQAKNEIKLAELKEKGEQLKTAKEAAEKKVKENKDKEQADGLQAKATQAKTDFDLNAKEIEAAERRKTILKGQIEGKQQQIKTWTEAIGEAAKGTIKTSASGAATFQGGDNDTNRSPASIAVDAVRAITLNAINQDYETQVCFETLRARNNVDQFKNEVNRVFEGGNSSDTAAVEFKKNLIGEDIFANHCKELLKEQVALRAARARVVDMYAWAVEHLVAKIGKGDKQIAAQDAAVLFHALSEAVSIEPGAAFLARDFNLGIPVSQVPLLGNTQETQEPTEKKPPEDLSESDRSPFFEGIR